MMRLIKNSKHAEGFTLAELLTAIGMISIISLISIPSCISWISNYRLKSAALDLFSNFQEARMRAIKSRGEYAILFNVSEDNYQLMSSGMNKKIDGGNISGDDIIEKTVHLSDYGGGIRFGHGNAPEKATRGGGVFSPGDEVSYLDDRAEFNSRGMANKMGYVYLENSRKSAYAISTPTMAGVIHIKRWSGGKWR
jgi:Tfp pilus assembly major pilin PilA